VFASDAIVLASSALARPYQQTLSAVMHACRKLTVLQIFRDDRFTYIAAQPQESPTLYEIKDGKPSLVNFDFDNGLYTVPKRIERGYLAIGKQRMNFWESAERGK
jgi:type IV secretion system protein VirB9